MKTLLLLGGSAIAAYLIWKNQQGKKSVAQLVEQAKEDISQISVPKELTNMITPEQKEAYETMAKIADAPAPTIVPPKLASNPVSPTGAEVVKQFNISQPFTKTSTVVSPMTTAKQTILRKLSLSGTYMTCN